MKLLYALSCAFLLAGNVQAQEYTRSGISVLHVNCRDQFDPAVDNYFRQYDPGDRYDQNRIGSRSLTLDGGRDFFHTSDDGKRIYEVSDRSSRISPQMERIGKEIASYLLGYENGGAMNLDLMEQRGMYSASDAGALMAAASKRGNSLLKDRGEELFGSNYAIVYDMTNLRYEYSKELGDGDGDYYWMCTPVAYLYKLDWDAEKTAYLYENCWVDSSGAEATRKAREAFDALNMPMSLVMKVSQEQVSVSSKVAYNRRNNKNADEKQLSDAAFGRMMDQSVEMLKEKLEKENRSFQLVNAVFSTHPIRVKTGRKEGVKTNQRFFVYENVSSDGTAVREVRKGVVVAGREVADNRMVASGDMPSTVFYQIAGRRVAEGMTIKEKKSLGLAVEGGYKGGVIGGVYVGATFSYVAGRLTNHTGMLNFTVGKETFTGNLAYGYGLRMNNFELFPYAGVAFDTFLNEEDATGETAGAERSAKEDDKKNAWLGAGGVRFQLNVYYPVQLFGGCEYTFRLWEGDGYRLLRKEKDRNTGGLSVYGGIRVCF